MLCKPFTVTLWLHKVYRAHGVCGPHSSCCSSDKAIVTIPHVTCVTHACARHVLSSSITHYCTQGVLVDNGHHRAFQGLCCTNLFKCSPRVLYFSVRLPHVLMQVEKMSRHIIQRKIAPSSLNNFTNQDVQNAFTVLVGQPYLSWKLPGKRVAQASVLRRHVSPQANFFLDKMSTNVQENAEQGMYGRATLLLVEMISLYSDIFPDGVELKVCAPLKSGDGKTMIDYAVLIVYVVSKVTASYLYMERYSCALQAFSVPYAPTVSWTFS